MSYIRHDKDEVNVARLKEDLGDLNNHITGYKQEGHSLTVYLSHEVTEQQKDQIIDIIENHDGSPESPLRIFKFIDPDLDIKRVKQTDFSIIGLEKETPSYARGIKTAAKYIDIDNDELVVEKIFQDEWSADLRKLTLRITVNWYNENGEIGLTKTEIARKYNEYETETVGRKRRYRQFDYLKASVRGTPYESFISDIVTRYNDEIRKYKEDALTVLSDAMSNEGDSYYRAILETEMPRNDDPTKTISVENAILYQMGLYTLEES